MSLIVVLNKMIDFKKINIVLPEKVVTFIGDQKNRMYLILGAVLLFSSLYFILMIFPNFSGLARTSTEINKLNFQINLVNSRVKKLNEMTRQLDAAKKEFQSYAKGLPSEKEIPEFLENLSVIAKDSGLKILGITPSQLKKAVGADKTSQYYREMPVNISAKSGYHQLGYFINSVENGERFVTVKDLKIWYDPKMPRMHNVAIVLTTYVWVENEQKK